MVRTSWPSGHSPDREHRHALVVVTSSARQRRAQRAGAALPVPVAILAGLAICFFALPFIGLLWRAPWRETWAVLSESTAVTALRLSIQCSLWSTALSLVLGVPLAWLLARTRFRGQGLVRALC